MMTTPIRHRMLASDRGSALVLALLASLVILILGSIGSYGSRTEIVIARNDLASQRALAIAEAGLNHARAVIASSANDLDDELSSGGTGGSLATIGSATSLDGTAYVFRAFDDGGYYVRADDNFDETSGADNDADDLDQRIRIRSIGLFGDARREVEGTVIVNLGPTCAVTVAQNLSIPGNPIINGSKGCVHANGNLATVSGNPRIAEGATSTGSMSISGSPTMESGLVLNTSAKRSAYVSSHSSQPAEPIPAICPLAFGDPAVPKNLAEEIRALGSGVGYLLNNDGRVYTGGTSWGCVANSGCSPTGATLVANADGTTWRGWKRSSDSSALPNAKWEYTTDTIHDQDKAFFIAGWLTIGANPGQGAATDWRVTLVALNTINVSGNPGLEPALPSTSFPTNVLRNVLLVSGNDLGLGGNAGSASRPGGLFAHQQIKVNGDPVIRGFLISGSGTPSCANDPAPSTSSKEDLIGSNELSGNMTLTYDGIDSAFFTPSVDVETGSWNEVRNR